MFYIRKIKLALQRVKKGYSDEDIWDFADFLCEMLPLAIREYKISKTTCGGCPGNLYDKDTINNECHKWHTILEEMAQGFEAGKEINETNFKYKKEMKDGSYTYEYDEKRAKLLTDKYNHGMKLFAKYFFCLWD